jgi:hypothetical protein
MRRGAWLPSLFLVAFLDIGSAGIERSGAFGLTKKNLLIIGEILRL